MRCINLILLLIFFYSVAAAQTESPEQRIARYTIFIQNNPDSISGYVNRAKAFNEKGDYLSTITDCNKALQLDANNYDALKYRGYAYYNEKKFDSSIADLSRAIKQNPKDAAVWNCRGRDYYWLNQLDESIKDISEAIRLDPSNAAAWFNRGEAYYWSEQYDNAIGDLSESLRYDPKALRTWYIRGMCYFYQRKLEASISDLTQALLLNSGNSDILYSRGLSYYNLGKPDSAIADFTEAIRLDPAHKFAWVARGNVYRNVKKYDLAIADYTQALLNDPKDADAMFSIGAVYLDMKNFNESINYFTKVIELQPDSTDALEYRGDAYTAIEKYDLALKDYSAVLKINPKKYSALCGRAICYKKMGKTDLALNDFAASLAINPKYSFALANRGDLYLNLGKFDLAANDYTEILNSQPKNFEARNNRANVFFYQAKYDLAISDYTMALLLNPTYVSTIINRGNAYVEQGKYDLAIQDYSQALSIDPLSELAKRSRGIVYTGLGKFDSSITELTEILRSNPKDTAALYWRGTAYYYQGKFDNAIIDYTDLVRMNVKYIFASHTIGFMNVLNSRGLAYYNLQKYDLAIADFKQAIDLKPENGTLVINLILVYVTTEKYDLAAQLYKTYREKNLSSYIEKSKAFSFLKNYITACCDYLTTKNYNKALELLQASIEDYKHVNSDQSTEVSPVSLEYANVLLKLAWTYEQLNQNERAIEYYSKAQVINPRLTNLSSKIESLKNATVIAAQSSTDSKGPSIQLLTPAAQGSSVEKENDEELFVSGVVKDINGISWVRINGTDVTNLKPDGYFAATLKKDLGSFTIQTADKKGLISSSTFEVKSKSASSNDADIPPIPPDIKPGFHAVLIACSNYSEGNWQKLPTTIKEAENYKKILTTQYDFDPNNVLEIYDKGRREILNALSSKLESLTEDDNLLILFAGHGTYRKAGNELIGYWVPLNASDPLDYISNGQLDEIIQGCKAKHILIISDACYSAAMRGNDVEDAVIPAKYEYKNRSRQILTSGGLEKVPGESVFIDMVMKTLSQNDDKYLSVKTLYSVIFKGVKNESGTEPALNDFGKDGNEGGQFYFIRNK